MSKSYSGPVASSRTAFGQIKSFAFAAPWWAKNRHVQTIYGRYFGQHPTIAFEPERVELEDGDFIDLAWAPKPTQCKGLLILFHGLEGSKDSHYIKHAVYVLSQQYHCVVMHFRGCSGAINRTHRAYHSGETSDPKVIISLLQIRYPKQPLYAMGFSLGGNMLCKLNAEYGAMNPLSGSVVVSAPLRLDACADAINHGFAKVYERRLLRSMQANLKEKMQTMDYTGKVRISIQEIEQLSSFERFDENVTAPLHGYAGAQDYYTQCSGLSFLHAIEKPTLLIHALDDPFMNEEVIPSEHQLSPSVAYELSQNGGHVGFFTGLPWRVKCDHIALRALDFLTEIDEIKT